MHERNVLLQTNQGEEVGTFAALYPEFARPDLIGWGDRVFIFRDVRSDDTPIYRETTAVYVIPPNQLPKEFTNG